MCCLYKPGQIYETYASNITALMMENYIEHPANFSIGVVTPSMLETSLHREGYTLNGDSDFARESSLGTKDKLPPFKRLSHKGMQEMSLKNLLGVTCHG